MNPRHGPTVLAGALYRAGRKITEPKVKLWESCKGFAIKTFRETFKQLSCDTDVSVVTWLAQNGNYSDKRKKDLQQKYDLIEDRWDPKYFRLKCFVKDEPYSALKYARAIYSRTDEFKCLVGPIFKQIESVVFAHPDFIKHISVPDRPEALMEKLYRVGARYCETDYTSMEAHFDAIRFELEFLFYEYMVEHLPAGKEFLETIACFKGINECIFKDFTLFLPGGRMSGEMNTSLGNGIVNWILSKFLAFCQGELDSHAGFFEGDDGAVVCEKLPTTDEYKDLGFCVKAEPIDNIYDMSFCGQVFDPIDKIVVTDPLIELADFGWSKRRYVSANKATRLALIRAKSISMLYQYAGCPILHSLARYGLRVTNRICTDKVYKFMSDWEKTTFRKAQACLKETKFREKFSLVPPMRTRLLVERLFKIPVEVQLRVEAEIDGHQGVTPLELPELLHLAPQSWKDNWNKNVLAVSNSEFQTYSDQAPFEEPVLDGFRSAWQ